MLRKAVNVRMRSELSVNRGGVVGQANSSYDLGAIDES